MKTYSHYALAALVAGCAGCTKDATSSPADAATPDAAVVDAEAPGCASGTAQAVTFTTDDGVTLAGDLYGAGKVGGPGAVLLHMIPPSNTRANFPRAFIDKLVGRGIAVLNIDRRGAGSSDGVATEAYQGPKGKLDAKAAVAYLGASPCVVDPARIALVGASNGTTSVLDFAVDTGLRAPKAMVFLTGGTYTESQNMVNAHRARLEALPIIFVFSKEERAWSAGFQAGAPPGWLFKEYEPGDHGTRMFAARPEAMDDVAELLDASLK